MRSKYWLAGWLVLVTAMLAVIGSYVYRVDPYFHYHKPDTGRYFYTLDNQRSQNDGICKHFDYDALVTGTSMTENFKISEVNALFGVNAIKVPYSGGTYKEINDSLVIAFQNNPNLKTVIRCLDYSKLLEEKDAMRNDLGKYPTYLYDSDPFNDVFYLFNKDVLFSRSYAMTLAAKEPGFQPGITSFDAYSRWQDHYTFGTQTVLQNGLDISPAGSAAHLSDADRETILANITQNVTSLADAHPGATFYYFFSPYSAAWWASRINDGTMEKWLEAEEYIISLILEHDNIRLFSFNGRTDITTDLNNYKDTIHYGEWVNSFMLRSMCDGKCRLTKENYRQYLAEERQFYMSFDYASLLDQEDYECDFYAAALLTQEITGTEPMDLLAADGKTVLPGTTVEEDAVPECPLLKCTQALKIGNGIPYEALMTAPASGMTIRIDDISGYEYLFFYGSAVSGNVQPVVLLYDDAGQVLSEYTASEPDNTWHQHLISVKKLTGPVTIVFSVGTPDAEGNTDLEYAFRSFMLY